MKELIKELIEKLQNKKNITILALFGALIIISSIINYSQKANFNEEKEEYKNEIETLKNEKMDIQVKLTTQEAEVKKLKEELEIEKKKTPEEKQKELDEIKRKEEEQKRKEQEQKEKEEAERKAKEEKEKAEEEARNKVPTKEEFLKQIKKTTREKENYIKHMLKGFNATLPNGAEAEYIEYLHMAMVDTKGEMKSAIKKMVQTKDAQFKEPWNLIVENYKNISIELAKQIDSDLAVGILNPLDESDFILIFKNGKLIHNFWED